MKGLTDSFPVGVVPGEEAPAVLLKLIRKDKLPLLPWIQIETIGRSGRKRDSRARSYIVGQAERTCLKGRP